ncbi:hypothetical protein SAMN05421688_1310 [Poseidonocella pacifica]|uniref:MOSC domain-containing protein n=1 Tax=Poseidonocella pacifica TaxID=871651 RepID=A0A1I0WDL4_9RHOB|nr:MOSC domain-containing protein [Poseidonocella pacifica]SFA86721.1 hypothetical protein SAMN05421688_1310 [Poseidonocella pacifica]
MPALKPTAYEARVVWLGVVPHRDAPQIVTTPLKTMRLGFGGYEGDVHSGVTRPSCSRVLAQHPKGTEIANVRQISIVSAEEMARIAEKIGVERLLPEWIGASIVIEGLPDLSHLSPSARLQGPDGVTLVVDMQNRPCKLPAITMKPEAPEAAAKFKAAAEGLRGVTAWVERPGELEIGASLRLHLPDQRAWQPDE